MKQFQLFYAFLKVGLLGYGGGPSSIPLVHKEVVERYKWLSDDEFGDILALGNTLPGPIATKMAGYIGYRVGGVLGTVLSLIATTVPTIILMIVLLTSLSSFKDLDWVQGMTKAVVPVVGVMLAVLTWQFFENAKKGLGWVKTVIFGVASLLLLEWLNVHPGILIGVLLVAALVKKNKKEQEGGSSS
ncbi:chromate transporter [Ferdinandcohnia quinoae]|uniref:Chromate transporter n=1 Tax=Fredinandcohnia quinoae TaxID=2918902 RepID=A0AAW5DYL5_9BACI|nr:chromate transporter [Fredinandcohnia sp. SECRCQ15]MCH1625168.1 chromate transporter [Fredinandcohnia sp. SECRCQ15]